MESKSGECLSAVTNERFYCQRYDSEFQELVDKGYFNDIFKGDK